MASSDPRDPIYGLPYTGTPVLQGQRGGRQTVLNMYHLAAQTIVTKPDDDHYTPGGDLYHE